VGVRPAAGGAVKPVFQRIIDQGRGDCWRCCIASILEVEAEAVPNFREIERADWGALERWLAANGLAMLELVPRFVPDDMRGKIGAPDLVRFDYICGAYAIASLPSQRFPGSTHAVVVRFEPWPEHPGAVRLVVAHDPNPGNEPYDLTQHTIDVLWFIVPVVPVRRVA
jgi:hypothetical protein